MAIKSWNYHGTIEYIVDAEADLASIPNPKLAEVALALAEGSLWFHTGTVWQEISGGGAGGVDVEDEGVAQGTATTLDFTGAGVTASFAAGQATINIPGGGSGVAVEEDNAAVGTASTLDFGTGLDVAFAAGEADVTVDLSEVTAFTDHSARHENGGADEITLAGLDGTPTELTNHVAAADPHTGYQKESEKNAVSGYAGLDASGFVIADTGVVAATALVLKSNGQNRLRVSSAGLLEFDDGVGGGLWDTNLYRSAANTLKTDDGLVVVLVLSVGADLWHTATDGTERLYFATGSTTFIKGYNPTVVTVRKADDTNVLSITDAPGLVFGSAGDTNLYRSAADTLKTDDSLVVAGTIKQSTTKDVLDTDHTAAADPHTGYLLESLLDAKGDLYAATAADTPARVAVGADGTVLTADSGAAAGVSWQTPGAGSHPAYATHAKFGVD